LSIYQGYAPALPPFEKPVAASSVFSPHLTVLRLERIRGPYAQLGLLSVLGLCSRWREAALTQSNDLSAEARSLLAGHAPDGTPLERPHLAFAPLAFVGYEHADGHLVGAGVVLPIDLPRQIRREVLLAVARVRELKVGALGVWRVEPVTESRPPWNLQAAAWTAYPAGATHWSTVTPVVYDHHPKVRDRVAYQAGVADMIRQACVRVGLPVPREVVVTAVSAHLGAPLSHEFPRLKRKDGSERRHTHAILLFDEPVCGPVLLGAGRYRGYGLCRPLDRSNP
jgi:CRISPR-associated protein Csb2